MRARVRQPLGPPFRQLGNGPCSSMETKPKYIATREIFVVSIFFSFWNGVYLFVLSFQLELFAHSQKKKRTWPICQVRLIVWYPIQHSTILKNKKKWCLYLGSRIQQYVHPALTKSWNVTAFYYDQMTVTRWISSCLDFFRSNHPPIILRRQIGHMAQPHTGDTDVRNEVTTVVTGARRLEARWYIFLVNHGFWT